MHARHAGTDHAQAGARRPLQLAHQVLHVVARPDDEHGVAEVATHALQVQLRSACPIECLPVVDGHSV